jgi:hypothetical protein
MMPRTPEEIDSDLKVQTAKHDDFLRTTVEYRNKLCARFDRIENKIDVMNEKIATIPCAVHIERMNGFEKRIEKHGFHIGRLYAIAGIIAMALISAFIGHAFAK